MKFRKVWTMTMEGYRQSKNLHLDREEGWTPILVYTYSLGLFAGFIAGIVGISATCLMELLLWLIQKP